MPYTQNPTHLNNGPAVPLHCGDGVTSLANGCPIIRLPGAILPSGLDAGLISVWTNGVGGADGGSIYRLDVVGNATNVSGPYAPQMRFECDGGGMSLNFASSANQDLGTFLSTHEGIGACGVHHLLSFQISTGTAYYYVNDAAQPVSWHPDFGGTFGATAASTVTAQYVPGGGGADTGGAFYSDAWFNTTTSLVDLTVTANRRKFINADLSPIDLGSNGQNPFGTAPILFFHVDAGGVAADWLTNRGSFGGTFSLFTGTLSLDGNPCATTGPTSSLAMDNILAIDETPALVAGSQIFLDWSDDRGHSFGSPVGQPIGATGAYLTSVQWQRLGMARDRVFRLTFSVPVATAIQGAFIEVDTSAKS